MLRGSLNARIINAFLITCDVIQLTSAAITLMKMNVVSTFSIYLINNIAYYV